MLRATVYLEDVRVDGGSGAGLAVHRDCTVTAMNSSFARTDTAFRFSGGRVHLAKCTVRDCAGTSAIAADCVFTQTACVGVDSSEDVKKK